MSTENQTTEENRKENVMGEKAEEVESSENGTAKTPTMEDFRDQLDRSFKKIHEGDILKGTVIGISETEVTLDLGYYAEGIIKLEELSNDPGFSIKTDVQPGEEIFAVVLSDDDGRGNILLSKKRADDIRAWDQISEAADGKKTVRVKISQAVKGGVVAYLYGIRAFIPASQLSLAYVEDLETWVGREVDAVIITASREDRKLVLSGREVEREKQQNDRKSRIEKLQTGIVTAGTVEKIMPYGAFVNIGDGLSGLVHISQMSLRRIKSPNEIMKEGDRVTVKVIGVKDGKVSLSMKAVEEKEEVVKDVKDTPSHYSIGGEATTGLGDLLKNIKLK